MLKLCATRSLGSIPGSADHGHEARRRIDLCYPMRGPCGLPRTLTRDDDAEHRRSMTWLVPRSRRGTLWRFVAAAAVVIGTTAAATAVAGLLQVDTIVGDLSQHHGIVAPQLRLPAPGAPQTILLIGSDHRAGAPVHGSNIETMLEPATARRPTSRRPNTCTPEAVAKLFGTSRC